MPSTRSTWLPPSPNFGVASRTGAGQIAHPRFENIEDAAHAVFVDQPERFNELLEKFVKDLPTTPAPAGSTP